MAFPLRPAGVAAKLPRLAGNAPLAGKVLEARHELAQPVSHKSELKRKERLALQKETVAKAIPAIAPGECWHIVSNGNFDYWRLIPLIIERNGPAHRLTASTWVMNRANVKELLEHMQADKIGNLDLIAGEHFKNTSGAPYATLMHGLAEMPGRWRMCTVLTHAKVAVIEGDGYCIVVEGSANWTANPRIEQNIIAWDEALGAFHKSWIHQMLEVTDGEAS